MTSNTKHLIVVDLETTGLHGAAVAVEVAAINVDTGESLMFVPHVTVDQLAAADPKAMEINGYHERKLWRDALTEQQTVHAWDELREWLHGNTFAGSNPAFDSQIVARETGKVWHHRLADLAAFAAGKLDWQPTELQGLDGVAERLGVASVQRHTAMGDAAATALCFDMLRSMKAAHL